MENPIFQRMTWGKKYHHCSGNSHVTSDVVDGFRLLTAPVEASGTAGTAWNLPLQLSFFHPKHGDKCASKGPGMTRATLLQRSTSNPFTHGVSAFSISYYKRSVF